MSRKQVFAPFGNKYVLPSFAQIGVANKNWSFKQFCTGQGLWLTTKGSSASSTVAIKITGICCIFSEKKCRNKFSASVTNKMKKFLSNLFGSVPSESIAKDDNSLLASTSAVPSEPKRLILLGSAFSGKSMLFKQFKLLHKADGDKSFYEDTGMYTQYFFWFFFITRVEHRTAANIENSNLLGHCSKHLFLLGMFLQSLY